MSRRGIVVLALAFGFLPAMVLGDLGERIEIDKRAPADPPGEVTYETWYRGGTTVAFNHELHAEMLELSCGECHHVQNCDACHDQEARTTVVGNRRVALHTSCFRCHESGPGQEGCDACHIGDGSGSGVAGSARLGREAHEELLDRMAKDAAELNLIGERIDSNREAGDHPAENLFVTGYEGLSLVRFSHATHGMIDCAACHHLERCGLCHAPVDRKVAVESAQTALRDNCIACHERIHAPTECNHCHVDPHSR